ncbi:MAG: VWA domain-containing protein [Myxococcota bacterium]
MRTRMPFALALTSMILAGCGASPTHQAPPAQMRVVVEHGSSAQVITGAAGGWIGGAPAQTQIYVGEDGQTYVGVWVEAPEQTVVDAEVRAPMAVSLVVDTSGSMAGEKIAHAQLAASSLLETLRDGDIVSLYSFSNSVQEVVAPTVLTPAVRGALNRSVGQLVAQGGTNLYEGLQVGQARLKQAPGTHPIRRVVLISDGHANVGPSDPTTVGQLAAQGTEWGVQVSAIGVGLDYDEHLLAQLAVQSSGRMYHLQHPAQMAAILEEEMNLLAQTVAVDAWVEIDPLPGVQIIDVQSLGARLEGNRLRVPIGNLHAGQRREVLFRARVNTDALGQRSLANARLSYREPEGGVEREHAASIGYEVTADRGRAETSQMPRVQAMVSTWQASQARLAAAEALNRGDRAAAQQHFDFAEDALIEGSLSAPAEMQVQFRQEAQRVRRSATRAAEASSDEEVRSVTLEEADAAMDSFGY